MHREDACGARRGDLDAARTRCIHDGAGDVRMRLEPGDGPAERRVVARHPGGDQRGDDGAGAVDVVGAPPAEPGAVGLLVREQPAHAAAAVGGVGVPLDGEHLDPDGHKKLAAAIADIVRRDCEA